VNTPHALLESPPNVAAARSVHVAIVGGGPVGLLLAHALHARGVSFELFERRQHRDPTYSRAIGIHPPSLAAFRDLGIDHPFLEEGVRVVAGVAHANRSPLGVLSFARLPGEFPFILTLPQARTEAILERELLRRAPGRVRLGTEVRDAGEVDADYVIACDGWRSQLREAAGIRFPGAAYPDTFLMGDFADCTPIGPRAGIYLCRHGLVESFPLPGKMRRYVVSVPEHIENPSCTDLVERITERIGDQPDPATNTMVSSLTSVGRTQSISPKPSVLMRTAAMLRSIDTPAFVAAKPVAPRARPR